MTPSNYFLTAKAAIRSNRAASTWKSLPPYAADFLRAPARSVSKLSAMKPIMPLYGIDTSVFVKLLTGDPAKEYTETVLALTSLLEASPGTSIAVSNQVIGEAYIALQHHYRIGKSEARQAMISVFQSGLVAPQHGAAALAAINTLTGCGLLDRLIAEDYHHHGCVTLTRDRRMAKQMEKS